MNLPESGARQRMKLHRSNVRSGEIYRAADEARKAKRIPRCLSWRAIVQYLPAGIGPSP